MPTHEDFEAFYAHYCPDQLESLNVVLASYEGREEELWGKLQAQHGPWPPTEGGADDGAPAEPADPPPAEAPAPAQLSRQGTQKSLAASQQQGSQPVSRKASVTGSQQPAAQLSRQGTARISRRGSVSQVITPAEAKADQLYEAMKGWGTDEAAVFAALGALEDQNEYDQVQREFKKRHPDMEGGDLLAALRGDLSKSEEGKVAETLLAKGIDAWQPAGPTPQISRQASRMSGQGSQPVQEPPAQSLSRQGTRQSLQEAASKLEQVSRQESRVSMGRQPSQQIQPSFQRQPSQVSAAAQGFAQPSNLGNSQVAVDDAVEQRIRAMQDEHAAQQEKLARAHSQINKLQRTNSELQRSAPAVRTASFNSPQQQQELQAARQDAETARSEADQLRQEVQQLRQRCQQQEMELRDRPDAAQVRRTEQILNDAHDRLSQAQQHAVQQQAEIESLSQQLSRAQEAIVHAANAGFEHDVKLHQARATLCSLMKKEKKREKARAQSPGPFGESPRAVGSLSPHTSAAPIGGAPALGSRYYDAIYADALRAASPGTATYTSPPVGGYARASPRMSPPRPHPQNLY